MENVFLALFCYFLGMMQWHIGSSLNQGVAIFAWVVAVMHLINAFTNYGIYRLLKHWGWM